MERGITSTPFTTMIPTASVAIRGACERRPGRAARRVERESLQSSAGVDDDLR